MGPRPLVLFRELAGKVGFSLSRLLLGPIIRRRALRALEYGRRDLGIDWPVEVHWRKDLSARGQVSSAAKHLMDVRVPQDERETVRTVLHELYHLAQFHKWGDLHPRKRKLNAGDLERAESLAELYARMAAKAFRRDGKRGPSRRERRIEIAEGETR